MFLEELLQKKKLYDWVTTYLVKIYEKRKEWEKASNLYKESSMAKSEQGKSKLALYKVLQGEQIVENGDEKSARIYYKDALKLNPNCTAAYLFLGDFCLSAYIFDEVWNAFNSRLNVSLERVPKISKS